MTRALGPFIAQVEGNLRSPVTRIRNKKKFLAQFCFEIIAHCFQGARGAFHPRIRLLGSLRCKLYPTERSKSVSRATALMVNPTSIAIAAPSRKRALASRRSHQ